MECSICLENMNKQTLIITNCGHKFHLSCLSKITNNTCPNCRTKISNFKSIKMAESEIINDFKKKIKFCYICGYEPWYCQEENCKNKICECLNYESIFVPRNPLEKINGLGCKDESVIKETCKDCYESRLQILEDFLVLNSPEDCEDLFEIYFKEEFNDFDDFLNNLPIS